jgi:hypothetical protein
MTDLPITEISTKEIGGSDALISANDFETDAWSQLWNQVSLIEERHIQGNDVETPRLSEGVVQGTRRLIRFLDALHEEPPTIMTGTCDGTITLEWHEPYGPKTFRSMDVLSENEAEEFILMDEKQEILRRVAF